MINMERMVETFGGKKWFIFFFFLGVCLEDGGSGSVRGLVGVVVESFGICIGIYIIEYSGILVFGK